ncbi:hypothetical protein GOV07_02205 [Candidatus Woesearchaeota archaeon]|nr:hypothetical protein [Candidatus Woesearchaeota archaeon]
MNTTQVSIDDLASNHEKPQVKFWIQQKTPFPGKPDARVSIIKAFTSPETANSALIYERIRTLMNANQFDVVLGPEYAFQGANGPLSAELYENMLEELRMQSMGKDAIIAPGTFLWYNDNTLYNSAPVFYDGDLVAEHHKHSASDDQRLAHNLGLRATSGSRKLPVFEVWEKRFGIEICAEQDTLFERGVDTLDGLFVPACGGDLIKPKHVSPKGIILYSDGYTGTGKITRQRNL